MGMVYVLTGLENKTYRPVAVVDNVDVADEWAKLNKNNDWTPLEMNDMSLTDIGGRNFPFRPQPPSSIEDKAMRAMEAAKTLEKTNQQLVGIIEQLAKKYKDADVLQAVKQLKSEGRIASALEPPEKWQEPGSPRLEQEPLFDNELLRRPNGQSDS